MPADINMISENRSISARDPSTTIEDCALIASSTEVDRASYRKQVSLLFLDEERLCETAVYTQLFDRLF